MDIDFLKQYEPFDTMSEEYLEEILEALSVKTFCKGDILFKRGKELDHKVFLMRGQVDLINSDYVALNVVAETERAFLALNPETPSATQNSAVVKSDIEVFFVDLDTLDESSQETPSEQSTMDDIEYHYHQTGEMQVAEVSDESATDWMSLLLQSPMFSRIPTAQVRDLFVKFEDMRLKAGDAIIKEGEVGDYFYVISSGTAKVTNKVDTVNLTLKAGDYFGEEALLGQTTRNATVIMETAGALKRLNRDDFSALLKEPVLKYVDTNALSTMDRPYQILDVKMPIEHRLTHVSGSINLPLTRLRDKLSDMDHDNIYLVADDAGSRADIAAHLLCQAGFEALILKSDTVTQ